MDEKSFYDLPQGIMPTGSTGPAMTASCTGPTGTMQPSLSQRSIQGDKEMADMITGTTTGFVNNIPDNTLAAVSDVRREAAEHTNEIVKEGLKGDYNTQGAIKDARFDINTRIGAAERSVDDRFFSVGRDLADIRAQIVQAISEVKMSTELNSLKGQIHTTADGERTRALINDLKYNDLNRALIERNAALVEEVAHRRHWRGVADQNQWAALQNQIQAFGSQLQETRQGMVNFGTMAGVGQTSSNNNA